MKIICAFLFLYLAADCLSWLCGKSVKSCRSSLSLVLFLAPAPALLAISIYSEGVLNFGEDFSTKCLRAVSPLIAASLVFSFFQVLISKTVSERMGKVVGIFRPVWLVGFLVFCLREVVSVAGLISGVAL